MKAKAISAAKNKLGAGIAMALLASLGGASNATELVYFPLNPSFGGSPLNGPVLLNSAQAQNKYTDPATGNRAGQATLPIGPKTPLQQFNETLERSILSRLSASAAGGITMADGSLMPGTVETSNFMIDVVDLGGGLLRVTTTDKTTGATSSFEVAS